MTSLNPDQREFWDRRADAWVRRADSLDALSDAYGIPVMDSLRLEPGQRVIDVGCGPGSATVELARRVAPEGSVVGVDISPAMVAAAQRRAEAAGVANVRFLVADAQGDAIGTDFDAAYSRFGVMFFRDPVAAFANICRSLRSDGRLACAVWGPLADNPWMFVPTLAGARALATDLALPGPDDPGPFSLAEVERIDAVLNAAGFTDLNIERIDGTRVITSSTAGDNVTALLEVGPLGEAYAAADPVAREAAIDAVVTALQPYKEGDGWRLPGLALKVTARCP